MQLKMADQSHSSDMGGCYYLVIGFLALPACIFLLSKLFPGNAKRLKKKLSAWMVHNVMWRVHLLCKLQKDSLLQRLKNLQTSGSVPHVLEIGVGSGYNLSFLPEKCKLSCLDPNPEFQKYVVQFLRDYPGVHLEQFSAGFAENMSQFETNTFDAVLCTFVLCSVRDPVKVVSEIKRVLKPGGTFFFVEHVAAPKSSRVRSVQDFFAPVWPVLVDSCHLTRETWKVISDAGFTDVKLTHFEMKTVGLFIVKFAICGGAQK